MTVSAAAHTHADAAGASPSRTAACTTATTKAFVRTFASAYGRGLATLLSGAFAPEPYFQWFSSATSGRRVGPQAYDRATLQAYFRARLRLHERIQVTRLSADFDANRGLVNFHGILIRRADDIDSAAAHPFKGAAECLSDRPVLIVWSM